METPPKKKPRKPAVQEKIYKSAFTESLITTSQAINEILTLGYAESIGIKCDEDFYNHPDLKEFYVNQFGDISNAIRRYGGRTVISVLKENIWVTNPKYHQGHPLRTKSLVEKFKHAEKKS